MKERNEANSAQYDRPAESQQDVFKFRIAIRKQAEELYEQIGHGETMPRITCPCGNCPKITHAFQCYHCGIWFCKACGNRHFGPAPSLLELEEQSCKKEKRKKR